MRTFLVALMAVTISGLGFARAEDKAVTTTEPVAKVEANVEAKAVETKTEMKKVEKKHKKHAKKVAVEAKKVEEKVTTETAPVVPATK